MSIKDQMPRSPATRVSVNGSKIKFIRESKGLTQLYIATFLGVTTDTVSRWENRRYPTVKWENVGKLAEALEVDVAEILDPGAGDHEAGSPPAQAVAGGAVKSPGPPKRFFLLASVAVIVLLLGVIYIRSTHQEVVTISATRFLPRHIAAGQPFPVVVRVESTGEQPFSFILEEKLPENFSVVRGLPEIASLDPATNTVKWIGNSRQTPFFLAYLVKTPSDLQPSRNITFTGRIKADNAPGFEQNIFGDSVLEISNYHWVDANSDGVIDDEEILMAFSSADVLRSLGVDMDLIKKIWSAGRYSWDQGKNKYQIIP